MNPIYNSVLTVDFEVINNSVINQNVKKMTRKWLYSLTKMKNKIIFISRISKAISVKCRHLIIKDIIMRWVKADQVYILNCCYTRLQMIKSMVYFYLLFIITIRRIMENSRLLREVISFIVKPRNNWIIFFKVKERWYSLKILIK